MPGTRLTLARAWYTVVGGIAALIGLGSLIGPIVGGCRITFSQADMGGVPGPCVSYADPISLAQVLVVGSLALGAGLFVTSTRTPAQVVVALGIVAGFLGGLTPALILVWAMDMYRYMPSPLEFAFFGIPGLIGLAAAVALTRAWWRGLRSPAAAAA